MIMSDMEFCKNFSDLKFRFISGDIYPAGKTNGKIPTLIYEAKYSHLTFSAQIYLKSTNIPEIATLSELQAMGVCSLQLRPSNQIHKF